MFINAKNFTDVSRKEVMTPAMKTIWDHMSIGVAIVDGQGTCVYMNEIQARVGGFSTSGVVGKPSRNCTYPTAWPASPPWSVCNAENLF